MLNPSTKPPATGGCLCGEVRFTVKGPLRAITICHCAMCRRSATALGAYSACAPEDITITGKPRWYRSSPIARRGFCAKCGSQLFWEPSHGGHLSIAAGALDDLGGLTIAKHIFLADDTTPLRHLGPPEGGEGAASPA